MPKSEKPIGLTAEQLAELRNLPRYKQREECMTKYGCPFPPPTLRIDPEDPCEGMDCLNCSDHNCKFSPCYHGPKVEPPED